MDRIVSRTSLCWILALYLQLLAPLVFGFGSIVGSGVGVGKRQQGVFRRSQRQETPDQIPVHYAVREGTFGMGCFWDPAEQLLKIDGVIDTVAGYTGKSNDIDITPPTYESVCFGREWVEAVRVIYDDDKITYKQLLDAIFEIQKPKLESRQYASIIFAHDEEQQALSQAWIEQNFGRQRQDGWRAEWTAMEPLSKFFQAEGYHQRYWQKQRPRFAVILGLLAVSTGLLNSVLPVDIQSTVETVANASVVVMGIAIALERFMDAKVVEI
jgi:peptide-methionine (S)-S-oxide reductase